MAGKHAGSRSSRRSEGTDVDPDAAADRRRSRVRAVAGLLALVVVAVGIVALTAVWDDPVGSPDPGGAASTGVAADPSESPDPSPSGPPPCPSTDDLDSPVAVQVDPAIAPTLRALVRASGCTGIALSPRPSAEVAAAALADETLPDVWVPESTLWVVRARPAGDAASRTPDGTGTAIAPEVVADSLAISPVVVATSTRAARTDATWRELIADPGLKLGAPLTSTAALAPLLGARVEADDDGLRPAQQPDELAPLARRAGARTGPPASDGARLLAAARSSGVAAVAEQTVLASGLNPATDLELSVPEVGTLVLDYPAVATATGERRDAAFAVAAWLGRTTATDAGTEALNEVGFRGPDGLPLEQGVTGVRALRLRDLGVLSQTLTAWNEALQAVGAAG